MLTPEAYQALLPFLDGPQIIKELSSRQKSLARDKLIKCTYLGWNDESYIGSTWEITEDGRNAIYQFEQHRRDRKLQIIGIIIGALTLIATIIGIVAGIGLQP